MYMSMCIKKSIYIYEYIHGNIDMCLYMYIYNNKVEGIKYIRDKTLDG